jgi:hypothetical protein
MPGMHLQTKTASDVGDKIMSKNISLIIALIALVLVAGVPMVAADNHLSDRDINLGGAVVIGETNLNVGPALNGATCEPLNTEPHLTVIGWWPSSADIKTTSAAKMIDLASRYNSLWIAPADFVGFTGNWYLLGPDGKPVNSTPLFRVLYFEIVK